MKKSSIPSDFYTTPPTELIDDDLTFLREMIAQPSKPPEPIDYNFLQKELSKRTPHQPKSLNGISSLEPQTKPPTRGPKYIRSIVNSPCPSNLSSGKIGMRDITYTFPEIESKRQPYSSLSNASIKNPQVSPSKHNPKERKVTTSLTKTKIVPNDNLPPDQRNIEFATQNRQPSKQPKSYVAWKFIGNMFDGNFGTLTGKLDASEDPTTLRKDFANIPYVLQQYHIEFPPDTKTKPKPKPRDLSSLSVHTRSFDDPATIRTVSRLHDENRERKAYVFDQQNEADDTQLYLETDTKLIPLVASRLPKGLQY